jgi:seryl-tRNA synthetase
MEQSGSSRETELQKREAEVAAAHAQFSETRSKAARIEAELTRAEAEKNDLQARLRANETEIAELRQRIESNQRKAVPDSSASDKTAELQAQLEDTRRQLEAAEREKILLSDKIKITEDKSTDLKTEHKHRPAAARDYPGIHGTVLAVNQAYNFVVLSLGARQGVEANSEMLVLRGGSFIGKIRISSVEPATAIGDIITSTLPRGVQVQPGDTVVYAGNNS